MKHLLKNALRRFGFDIVRYPPRDQSQLATADLSDEEKRIIALARPFTMTTVERMLALINAVNYVCSNNIPGDIAECGVWRGGSMMVAAAILLARGDTTRSLYLYDTYEGMSEPTEHDKSFDGASASQRLQQHNRVEGDGFWCYATVEDVRANLVSTGYPAERIHLIKGKVEETIPQTVPPGLAILRLDTDWYESTRHELIHLYPLLHQRGILIIDDYGYWQGARKAVDEYFQQHGNGVFMHRIDYSGRLLVKPHAQE